MWRVSSYPEARSLPGQGFWLVSRGADFWLASGAASAGLLVALLIILCHSDRELDWLDVVLSDLHVGATYDAIVRRRLWRRMPWTVVLLPLIMLVATYVLMLREHTIIVTTLAFYAAIWHRGRQSLGVARYYQRQAGGPLSALHCWLFRGAIYLPMAASALCYSRSYPKEYEGNPYAPLSAPDPLIWAIGVLALVLILAYLAWSTGRTRHRDQRPAALHPAERWIVMAHAVAFGSAYAVGAWNASFIFVLAIYHEVQYLYFAYALVRREVGRAQRGKASERRGLCTFALGPMIGLTTGLVWDRSGLELLAPVGIGVLFCHYWLDGRIWTRRALGGAEAPRSSRPEALAPGQP